MLPLPGFFTQCIRHRFASEVLVLVQPSITPCQARRRKQHTIRTKHFLLGICPDTASVCSQEVGSAGAEEGKGSTQLDRASLGQAPEDTSSTIYSRESHRGWRPLGLGSILGGWLQPDRAVASQLSNAQVSNKGASCCPRSFLHFSSLQHQHAPLCI